MLFGVVRCLMCVVCGMLLRCGLLCVVCRLFAIRSWTKFVARCRGGVLLVVVPCVLCVACCLLFVSCCVLCAVS